MLQQGGAARARAGSLRPRARGPGGAPRAARPSWGWVGSPGGKGLPSSRTPGPAGRVVAGHWATLQDRVPAAIQVTAGEHDGQLRLRGAATGNGISYPRAPIQLLAAQGGVRRECREGGVPDAQNLERGWGVQPIDLGGKA